VRNVLPILLGLVSCTSAALSRDLDSPAPAVAPAARAHATSEQPGSEQQPLSLAPGELVELPVRSDGSAGARLTTAGAEEFVLVLASTDFRSSQGVFDYGVSLGKAPAGGSPSYVTGCSLSPERFASLPLPVDPPSQGRPPAEGTTRKLLIPTASGHQRVDARAVSVGSQAVIWLDTTQPSQLDRELIERFRDDFERVIMPRSRAVFGTEPDTDGDGRIDLVFSPLTRETGVAFFSACDLLPEHPGCDASNRGEFLYLTPPEAIAPPYNTPNAIKEILTHEVSHLLHFNRKVLRNKLTTWADGVYVAEGIGGFAQDVTGFQAGNLYVTKAGLDGIDQVSLSTLLFSDGKQPKPFDGILRGAGYLFVRYLYDRAGGDVVHGVDVQSRGGPALVRALIDAPKPVAQALPDVTFAATADLALDFFSALALSNRTEVGGVAPANACFSYLPTVTDPVTGKQRGANTFAGLHGQRMNGPRVVPLAQADGKLRQGGVEYLALTASPGERELAFSLNVAPAAAARVRLARLR
jgi:hypothetical protein